MSTWSFQEGGHILRKDQNRKQIKGNRQQAEQIIRRNFKKKATIKHHRAKKQQVRNSVKFVD